MVSRARLPKKTADDKIYPVRLRVVLPPARDTSWLPAVYAWLNQNAPKAHAVHSGGSFIGREEILEGMLIYLEDIGIAHRLVEELQLTLLPGPKGDWPDPVS